MGEKEEESLMSSLFDDAEEEDILTYDEDEVGIEAPDDDNESNSQYIDEESDFDFSQFYQDEESTAEPEVVPEDLGLYNDEEAYDEILDLHSEVSTIAVEAEYPYIRISGFVIKDEIVFMQKTLQEYMEGIKNKYSADDMLDIMLNVNGEDYMMGKVPLTLDTFLTIFKAHRYEVSLVRSETVESAVTSELMKAFLFT